MPSQSRGTGRLGPALLVVSGCVTLAGCAEGQNMLSPHGQGAQDIASVFWVIFWMAAGVFVVVEGLLLFAIFRFRAPAGGGLPRQVQGNTPLEVAWTIVPALVLAGVVVATLATMKAVAAPAPNALEVTVIGHQWWWEFRYPAQKVITSDELHIPLNQPVTVHVTSDDVVHNFWIPELDRKLQALPGHDNVMSLTATKTGTYNGFCAEFCGVEHAMMRFTVVVQTPDAFNAWLQGQAAPPAEPQTAQEKAGQQAFNSGGCNICHQIGAMAPQGFPDPQAPSRLIIGPNLSHFASRQIMVAGAMPNDPTDMQHWLQDPNAVKQGNLMSTFIHGPSQGQPSSLSPQQVQDLTAYLESLK